ncbi:MAG: hypothetical protein RR237_05340, partial [Acetivibrio sp.]
MSWYYLLLGENIDIIDISPGERELGYTSGDNSIHLAEKFSHLIKNVPKKYHAFFRKGVFVHESLHKLLTDFQEYQNAIESVRKKYNQRVKYFCTLLNLLEDAFIESYASQYVYGSWLKALMYQSKAIYEDMPLIEDFSSSWGQYEAALHCFKRRGILKNEIKDEKAKTLFEDTVCMFYAATIETDAKLRAKAAIDIFEKIKDIWADDDTQSQDDMSMLSEYSVSQGSMSGDGKPSEIPDKKDDGDAFFQAAQLLSQGKSVKENESLSAQLQMSVSEMEPTEADLSEGIQNPLADPVAASTVTYGKGKNEDIDIYNEFVDEEASSFFLAMKRKNGTVIQKVANQLERILVNYRDDISYKNSGKLNVKKYISHPFGRIFTKNQEIAGVDAAIFVLIDVSGSMGGRKIKKAQESALILSEAAKKNHLPIYVMGHTAGMHKDVDLYHYVTWKSKSTNGLSKMSSYAGNFDGEAIRQAVSILNKRKETTKLLFVISDGMPSY